MTGTWRGIWLRDRVSVSGLRQPDELDNDETPWLLRLTFETGKTLIVVPGAPSHKVSGLAFVVPASPRLTKNY